MRPVDFDESNVQLFASAGGAEEDCGTLPVWTDGAACISCWSPNEEERAAIAAGEPVWLYVWSGRTQPPVALTVVHPFRAPGVEPPPGLRTGESALEARAAGGEVPS